MLKNPSLIIIQDFSQMIAKVYESYPYTPSKYHVFAFLIFNIVYLDYSYILRYLSKLLCFVSNIIQISRFFEILKEFSYLSIFPLLFSKKGLKNTKKLNKITKIISYTYKITSISSIIIGNFV